MLEILTDWPSEIPRVKRRFLISPWLDILVINPVSPQHPHIRGIPPDDLGAFSSTVFFESLAGRIDSMLLGIPKKYIKLGFPKN